MDSYKGVFEGILMGGTIPIVLGLSLEVDMLVTMSVLED